MSKNKYFITKFMLINILFIVKEFEQIDSR